MKWAVISKYYNNGKVSANIIQVEDNAESNEKSNDYYDEYIDIFDTLKEADAYKRETLDI